MDKRSQKSRVKTEATRTPEERLMIARTELRECFSKVFYAVDLFQWSKLQIDQIGEPQSDHDWALFERFQSWMCMAGRDLIFSLWGFESSLNLIRAKLVRSITLQEGEVDAQELKDAFKTFQRQFPRISSKRNMIGHMPQALAGESTIGNSRDNIRGDDYTGFFGGENLEIAMTKETVEQLRAIYEMIDMAFAGCKYEVTSGQPDIRGNVF